MAIYSTTKEGPSRTDHLVDFETKDKAPWIIENAYRVIQLLYKPNDPELETCMGYYNAVRPPAKFAALADNYGIGTPHKIPFMSLMQRHVRALTGYYMQLPFPATVSAVDSDSISLEREEMARTATTGLMQLLNQTALAAWQQPPAEGQPGAAAPQGPPPVNQLVLQDIRRQTETYTSQLNRFTSVLLDSLVARLKLREKSADLVESRAVTGRFYHRAWLENANELPRYEVIPVEEMHHLRDRSLGNVRNHRQVLRHRRMLRSDVLAQWGHKMDAKERELVAGKNAGDLGDLDWVPLRAGQEIGAPRGTNAAGNPQGFLNGPYLDQIAVRKYGLNDEKQVLTSLIDVYEGEFISTSPLDEEDFDDDEEGQQGDGTPFELRTDGDALSLDRSMKADGSRYRQHVYRFVRIGSCIYLNCGRYKYAQRPSHDLSLACLSYDGVYGQRSMIMDTVDLQDKSDLLNFHQDNLIALGGVPGLMLDINDIPAWFDPKDKGKRIAKFLAQVKSGLALVDRSQTGKRQANQPDPTAFNNSGKIDTSFNAQAVAAIREQLAYINEQAQQISGIPRQMQGEIQERDGLGTTNQAIASASAVNRPLYSQIFSLLQDGCTDLINLSRVTARHNPPLIGLLIGTAGAKVIGLGAERFPLASFNVFVRDAMDEEKSVQRLQNSIDQLVGATAVDPKLLIDTAMISNTERLKEMAYRAIEDHQQNALQQVQQQLQQAEQQLKQLQQADTQLQQATIQTAQQKVANDLALGQAANQIQQQKVQQEGAEANAQLELEEQRVNLEAEELFFNKQSLEVSNN